MNYRITTIALSGVIVFALIVILIATIVIWQEAAADNAAYKSGTIHYTNLNRTL